MRLSAPSYVKQVQTDAQGVYSIKGTIPGTYSLQMAKLPNTSEPRARAVTVIPGQKINLDLRIPKGVTVSGRILDRNKQPVPGILVVAMTVSSRDGKTNLRMMGEDKSNDLGEYRIPYLPAGTYVVGAKSSLLPIRKRNTKSPPAAESMGYPPVTFYPGTRLLSTAAFEIGSGADLYGMDIVLQKEPVRCVSFRAGAALSDARTASP